MGDNASYKRAMAEGETATRGFSAATVAGFAAATAAAALFAKKSVDTAVEYGKSIAGLSRISGESVETMSKLAFAGKMTGTSTETLSNGIKFLGKNMAANNPEFDRLGVATRNADGSMRSTHAVLLDTAAAIQGLAPGAERTGALLKIFGRNGLEMGRLMGKGADGIRELEAQTTKYGLLLTGDNMATIMRNVQAHRQMDAAVQGLQVQIGLHLLPVLTAATEKFAGLLPVIAENGGTAGALMAVGVGFASVVKLGPQIISAFSGMTAGAVAMNVAISGLAMAGIVMLLAYWSDVMQTSKETQQTLHGGIDWTNRKALGAGVDAEGRAVDALGKAWNDASAAYKATHWGDYKIWGDASKQYEADLARVKEWDARIRALGGTLGITTEQAQGLADSLRFDPTTLSPDEYTPVLYAFQTGAISAAEATDALNAKLTEQASAGGNAADRMKQLSEAIQSTNDAERSILDPQFALVDAQNRLRKAQADAAQTEADKGAGSQDAEAAAFEVAKAAAAVDYAARSVQLSNDQSGEASGSIFQRWIDDGLLSEHQADLVGAALDRAKAAADALNGTKAQVDIDLIWRSHMLAAQVASPLLKLFRGIFNNNAISDVQGDNMAQQYIDSFGGGAGPPGFDRGGTLSDGFSVVGESGRELVYKSGSRVAVISAAQSQRMLSPGVGNGGYAHHGDIVIQAPSMADGARDLVWLQRKAALEGAF